ncbi:MAG: ABC transporter permease [Candidatus Humimicrobiaceae bacterium]
MELSTISKIKNNLNNIAWAVITIAAFVILWQLAAMLTGSEVMLPGPIRVLSLFIKSLYIPIGKYTLLGHMGWSLSRMMIGYSIGSILGIVIGLSMGWSKFVESIIKPIFEVLRPIPPLAWIPLGILWFGIGELTKYFIIFIGTFVTVTLNAYGGAQRVDPILLGAARTLGAKENQLFTKIVLPSSVPSIFAGLQVGLSNAWMAVLAAEMVRSTEGAGWIIIMGMQAGDTAQVMVGMIAIGLVGLLIINIVRGVETKLCAWNIRGR